MPRQVSCTVTSILNLADPLNALADLDVGHMDESEEDKDTTSCARVLWVGPELRAQLEQPRGAAIST